ncbi:MAG: PAS domain S-box protein, partial [Rhodoferax sp.]|nr:PAS domain S-box protein [Rhodoferax sp.]
MNSVKFQKFWLGLLLANLFVFALVAFAIVQNRQRSIDEAEKVAVNYSHTLEENLLGFIQRIDLTLLATTDELQRQRQAGKPDAMAMVRYLERQHARVPEIVGLRISDAQGTIRFASGGVSNAHANIADLAHFQAARDSKVPASDQRPLFSEPMLGRVSNLRVINILRRYENADGTFGGVVIAGITIEHLSEILRTVDLSPYSVDSVWTRKQLIARNAKNDFLDAKGAPPKPVVQLQALIDSGDKQTVYHTAGTVDGITRLVSARQVGNYPLYLAVGLADRDFLQRWYGDAVRLALFAAVFSLCSCALTWLVVRSEKRQQGLTKRLLIDEQQLLQLNQRLDNERSLLKTLINTIPELVWLKNVKGVYLACNPAFEKFFGHAEADIVGKTDFDFVDAELAHFFRANDLAALDAAEVVYNEEWITYPGDGRRALLRTGKTPMYDTQGVVLGVLGIAHDITAQRHTEETLVLHQHNLQQLVDERTQALNASNQKLLSTQFAMECVGIGIHWVHYETGQFIVVNQKAADMVGYTVEEMLGLKVMDVDTNFTQAKYDHIKEVIRSKGHITIETTQRHRNGDEVPLEVSIYFHEGGEAMPPHFISFQTDITQRKAAQQALINTKLQAERANERSSALVQELEMANRRLLLNDQRLSAMFALSQAAPKLDEPEILQRGIDEAVRLTGSHIGYLHFVGEDQESLDLQTWSSTTQQHCAAGQSGHYPISRAGIWADSLRSGQTVVHNDYPSLGSSHDFPLGHVPLQRHLGVPVMDGGKTRLLVGVGNKP